jgi:hypothetical protein
MRLEMRILLAASLAFAGSQGELNAQSSHPPPNGLLARLEGHLLMVGKVRGHAATYDLVTRRILNDGSISGDSLLFQIPYPERPFRDTFVFQRTDRTWMFRLEASDGHGGWESFAEYEVRPVKRGA